MAKIHEVPAPLPEINRLRAVTALTPIIGAGLADSKMHRSLRGPCVVTPVSLKKNGVSFQSRGADFMS